jgi:hypothetical protein
MRFETKRRQVGLSVLSLGYYGRQKLNSTWCLVSMNRHKVKLAFNSARATLLNCGRSPTVFCFCSFRFLNDTFLLDRPRLTYTFIPSNLSTKLVRNFYATFVFRPNETAE